MTLSAEDRRIQNEGSWTQDTVLFSDGKDGAASQVHHYKYSPMPLGSPIMASDLTKTPISAVWTRKSRSDKGRFHWFYRDEEVADLEVAKTRWRDDGEPQDEPGDAGELLKRVTA